MYYTEESKIRRIFFDYCGLRMGWMITFLIVGCLLFITVLLGVGLTAGYYHDKALCKSFGNQTNREVKFVRYTIVSWDCLTPTANGKWISTSNIRDTSLSP